MPGWDVLFAGGTKKLTGADSGGVVLEEKIL